MVRKASTPKANDKRKRRVIAKRGYKVRALNQPMPTTTAPMTATTSTQTQTTGFATTTIPVMVHNLQQVSFQRLPIVRSSVQNPPPLEDIPKASVRQGTTWPNAGSTSENLFKTRKDWPIPPTPAPTSAPTMKTEAQPQVAEIPKVMVVPRQPAKNCT